MTRTLMYKGFPIVFNGGVSISDKKIIMNDRILHQGIPGKRLRVNGLYKEIEIVSDKKIIKGEDIGAEIGSEWEIQSDRIDFGPGTIHLHRIPEKSDFEKWNQPLSHRDFDLGVVQGRIEGALKMIEIAEHYDRLHATSGYKTVQALKRFSGIKD